MEITKRSIEQFMTTPDVVFTIPFYQRNYDWSTENCDQLLTDIVKIIKGKGTHFLGNICFKNFGSHEKSIIDGQQRLTTIMLMMKALCDLSYNKEIKDKISSKFIYNSDFVPEMDSHYVRLRLNIRDNKVYRDILEFGENIPEKSYKKTNIYQNYMYFKTILSERMHEGLVAQDVWDALKKTIIVEVDVENENPQEIFESLNATGVGLTQIELLRNYLLMPFSDDGQRKLYTEYWSKIEENVSNGTMDDFFYDYLIYKRFYSVSNGKQSTVRKNKLYLCFKEYYQRTINQDENNTDFGKTENVFADLLAVSEKYKGLLFDNATEYSKLDDKEQLVYANLYLNKNNASRPVLIELLTARDSDLMSEDELMVALRGLLAMTFRARVACTTGISYQAAYNILYRIDNNKKDISYLSKFFSALTAGKNNLAFPSDEVFFNVISTGDLYLTLRNSGVKYLLYTLEQHSAFAKELPPYDNKITIEHIMPQKLSDSWFESLDPMEINLHDEYVHRLGNLALTGMNSEMSNSAFKEKSGYYLHSAFYYTQEVAKSNDWNIKSIDDRSKELAGLAVKIWDIPSEYKKDPLLKNSDLHTFAENPDEFTHCRPAYLLVKDKEYITGTWKKLLTTLCNVLIEMNPDAFNSLKAAYRSPLFDSSDECICEKLSDGSLIKCNMSASAVVSWCRKIIKMFDLVAEKDLLIDILFAIQEDDE